MISAERLRELEWAAAFVRSNPPRQGCRCGGTCAPCSELAAQRRKIGPDAITELVNAVRAEQEIADRFRESLHEVRR